MLDPTNIKSSVTNTITEPKKSIPKQPIQPSQEVDNLVIGTSLVHDVGLELNYLGHYAMSYSSPGCHIRHILHRVSCMIHKNFTGNITLLCGGNDCEVFGAKEVIVFYEELIEAVHTQAPDCRLLLCAIPPRTGSNCMAYKICEVNCFLLYVARHEKDT